MIRGLALAMNGEPEEGIAVISDAADQLTALGSHLDAAQAWRELAEALIHLGRSAQAIDALRRAADYAGARSSTIRAEMPVPASLSG